MYDVNTVGTFVKDIEFELININWTTPKYIIHIQTIKY